MHKIFLFFVLILVFVVGFLATKNTLSRIYRDIYLKPAPSGGCDADCQKAINESVSKAVATLSAGTKTILYTNAPPSVNTQQVSYIPLDGTFSTTSTDWTDAKGIEVSFDLTHDYGAGAKVSWEASLRVANANGQAFARLFDITHGIAVAGSEISVTNSADYQRVSSGNLNLWSGRNVYRVQVKSLNSFNIDYSSGKIRISY